ASRRRPVPRPSCRPSDPPISSRSHEMFSATYAGRSVGGPSSTGLTNEVGARRQGFVLFGDDRSDGLVHWRSVQRSLTLGFPITLGCIPRCKQSGRFLEIDGLHEHSFLAVGKIGLTLSRRGYETGRRFLKSQRIVDTGKVDSAFKGAT